MRIKTRNKIVEASNIEYDAWKQAIYTDEIAVKIDNHIRFNQLLRELLTFGYADLSEYDEI